MSVVRGSALEFQALPGRRSADPFPDGGPASSMRVVEMEHTPGRTAHRHPHSEEVVYVEAGSGQVWIDGDLVAVTAGDIVHIPAGTDHATIPDAGVGMRLVCYFPHPDLAANLQDTDIVVS
jgi:quercetin dioxygenase-like cupin family protein